MSTRKLPANIINIKPISTRIIQLILGINSQYKGLWTSHEPRDEMDEFYEDLTKALKENPTKFPIKRVDFNTKKVPNMTEQNLLSETLEPQAETNEEQSS